MSSYIIEELFEVIDKKFPGKTEALENFLARIPFDIVINSEETDDVLNVNIRDKNDEEVLISAVQANVDLFITGD